MLGIKVLRVPILYSLKIARDTPFFFFLYKKVEMVWHYSKCTKPYSSCGYYFF